MSRQTLINTPDDMEWLFDVHVKLKDLKISWTPRAALVIGNEDCPDEIHLYPRREPLVTDDALIGKYNDEGDRYIFCGPLDHKTAMEIDEEERANDVRQPDRQSS